MNATYGSNKKGFMQYSLYMKRITKNDMYRVLREKFSYSIHSGLDQKVLIYKETIDLLENYDAWLLQIKNNEEPTFHEYNLQRHRIEGEVERIIKSLIYLRAVLEPVDELEFIILSKLAQYFNFHNTFNRFDRKVTKSLNRFLSQEPIPLCLENIPSDSRTLHHHVYDAFFALMERIKPKVLADKSLNENFGLGEDEKYYEQRFLQVLNENNQVFVLCLNIKIELSFLDKLEVQEQLIERYLSKIELVKNNILQTCKIHHILSKIELFQKIGLNLHCILVLDEDKYFSEDTYIIKLQEQLVNYFQATCRTRITIENWNSVIRRKFSKKAVGIISRNNHPAINECWYWVFSYYFALNQVMRFHSGLEDNDELFDPTKTNTEFKSLMSFQPSNKFSDLRVDDPEIFSNRKHLPDLIQKYLKQADLIYSMYPYILSNLLTGIEHKNIVTQIEVFCETLKIVKPELLLLPQGINLLPIDLHKYLTRLGRMWWIIYDHFVSNSELMNSIPKGEYQSENIRIFYKFMYEKQNNINILCQKDLNQTTVDELNSMLIELKKVLGKNNLIQSVKYLESRLKNTQQYARYLFAKDVYMYRIQLSFNIPNTKSSKSDQSEILTEFMRVGQSAKPLCWLRGYILRWDNSPVSDEQKGYTYADLTLVIEYQSKLDDVDIQQQFKQYLDIFLNRYNVKKQLSQSIGEVSYIKTDTKFPATITELHQNPFKVETVNKELIKCIKQSYLPYICYLDLFKNFNNIDSNVKFKRFTTGKNPNRKSKPKPVITKSSSSKVDEVDT